MKIHKNSLYFVAILVIVIIGGYLVMSQSGGEKVKQEGVLTVNGETQKVVISMKNYNYYPQEIRIKAGKPVEISLDESVGGCFRDFTVREFGIREYLETPQDSVTFTPTKPGRYTFACSMGMGQGTFIVE